MMRTIFSTCFIHEKDFKKFLFFASVFKIDLTRRKQLKEQEELREYIVSEIGRKKSWD